MNRNDGKIATKRLPAVSVIEAHPYAFLGSGVKKSAACWIFAHNASEFISRNSCYDELPRRAVIGRPVDVRLQVIHLVVIRRDVRCSGSEARRLDHRDAA